VSATASAALSNKAGLHARPAVQLTQLAKKFAASLEFALQPEGPWTDAKSPVKVMRVKAPMGATLHFRSDGADADAAIAAVLALVHAKFGED
jgi:phosphocarrier protein HPr